MVDIIWGNVGNVLSGDVFELNVTHRKDDNKNEYADVEKIKIIAVDFSAIPKNLAERTKQIIEQNMQGKFVKCEIKERDNDECLLSEVSHSGAAGY